MKRFTTKSAGIAGAAVVLAGLGFGSMALAGGPSPPVNLSGDQAQKPVQYTQPGTYDPTAGMPSGASPAAIAQDVLQRAGADPGLTVNVGAAPALPGVRPGVWLNFTVPVPGTGTGPQVIREAWEADVIQGAIADSFTARGLTSVSGSRITGELSNGSTVDLGGGMGDVAAGQNFSSDSDAIIEQNLRAVLAASALTPVSIDVLHAAEPAPAVVAQTSDPASAAAAANSTIQQAFGQNPPRYEGYYFEIQDKQGNPVLIQSASFRTGSGRQWVNPQYASDSSLNHG